jgi:alpha-L-rhamnosidase
MPRRLLCLLTLAAAFGLPPALLGVETLAQAAGARAEATLSIVDNGALPGDAVLNTGPIQAAIDRLARQGGGTLVIPKGVFRSGALFLRPGVNLRLESGAMLKGSTDIADYPRRRTRIEGQLTEWIPALVNAEGCDHLRIDGSGTLDGGGQAFYTRFWEARARSDKTTNLEVERPRLIYIADSRDLRVGGVTLHDSGFWNLHLYRCSDVLIEGLRIEAPYGKPPLRGPSTDGMDLDSCQRITVRGCTFAVNDDCICLKGTKGPFAMEDKDSPPTEHIRISDCTFEAGHGALTLGSEASIVRDVVMENCRVTGQMPLMRLKLRRDTPQLYEDVHFRNITLICSNPCAKDQIVEVAAWSQFFDLKGQAIPHTFVRNISLSGLRGHCGAFGEIVGIPGQTEIRDVRFDDIDITLDKEPLHIEHAEGISFRNVRVNGRPYQR